MNDESTQMPNKDFEISFSFKTKQAKTSLFSIDNPSVGGHDRHINLVNGQLIMRVWPGGSFYASKKALNDDKWHSVSLRCESGTKCVTTIDGKKGMSAPVDHSNFDWASRMIWGYSADNGIQFNGQMKDMAYRSLSAAVVSSANIDSAAEYVKTKIEKNKLVVNEDVNIDDLQFVRLAYHAAKAGATVISFEGKVNFVGSIDKWEKTIE